jgi:hypothetical protein
MGQKTEDQGLSSGISFRSLFWLDAPFYTIPPPQKYSHMSGESGLMQMGVGKWKGKSSRFSRWNLKREKTFRVSSIFISMLYFKGTILDFSCLQERM